MQLLNRSPAQPATPADHQLPRRSAPPSPLYTTPAMAANITKRFREIPDIVDMLEAWEHAK